MRRHSGEVFGRLTLVEPTFHTSKSGRRKRHWVCRCSCGVVKEVSPSNLLNGCVKSCGCLKRETSHSNAIATAIKLRKHPTHGSVLSYYKKNAKSRDLPWGLTTGDFTRLILGKCEYCGSEPKTHSLKGETLSYNGIDRVDNSLGYTVDNTVSCCITCNRSKDTMDLEKFRDWVFLVANHLGGGA